MLHAIGLHVIPYVMYQGYNANLPDFLDEERRRALSLEEQRRAEAASRQMRDKSKDGSLYATGSRPSGGASTGAGRAGAAPSYRTWGKSEGLKGVTQGST